MKLKTFSERVAYQIDYTYRIGLENRDRFLRYDIHSNLLSYGNCVMTEDIYSLYLPDTQCYTLETIIKCINSYFRFDVEAMANEKINF